jgi:hypothetical protein
MDNFRQIEDVRIYEYAETDRRQLGRMWDKRQPGIVDTKNTASSRIGCLIEGWIFGVFFI